ncbi:MAG: DUF4160 domain-containing protein [Chloroflexi bacterium]|nr:DUF4160 domain-containing protein [Chloroflexota bacterium]
MVYVPTVLIIGSYRFFFNSREETRRHIHVASSDGVAKYWLEPVIALADYHHLSSKELNEIERLVRQHAGDFTTAWDGHFSQ